MAGKGALGTLTTSAAHEMGWQASYGWHSYICQPFKKSNHIGNCVSDRVPGGKNGGMPPMAGGMPMGGPGMPMGPPMAIGPPGKAPVRFCWNRGFAWPSVL